LLFKTAAQRFGWYGDFLPGAACNDAMATALLNRKMPFESICHRSFGGQAAPSSAPPQALIK
jgi:hypothetical protein